MPTIFNSMPACFVSRRAERLLGCQMDHLENSESFVSRKAFARKLAGFCADICSLDPSVS